MDSSSKETVHDFPPFFKVYKDGTIERHAVIDTKPVPTGLDPATAVQSKDVIISAETGLKARIFMPTIDSPGKKLPLLVHYHGGGFSIGSALDSVTRDFLTFLVRQAKIMAISIEYRLAPEHLLPIAYDDSWAGLAWVATHSNGQGPEPWLNEHADLGRVFLVGESAGANIAHNVAVRAGVAGLAGLKIVGVLIVHPFFGGEKTDEMYKYICPTSSGNLDDPRLNPAVDPNLKSMAGERVMVFVAEKDWLRNRGERYYQTLVNEWGGNVEFFETEGEDHCFHMFNKNESAEILKKKIVDFVKMH